MPIAVNSAPQPARRSREPAIGRVEVRGEAHIAIDQEAVETEDLHFLGGFDAGGSLPHIVEFAPLRRAAVIERIALRVEMRLADEGRHQRHKQKDDQPGRVEDQAGSKTRDRHDVLGLTE